MLTPYLPYPPSSGGQVRSYNLIKHLSKNHEIYLVSLIKSRSEESYKQDLTPYCKEIHLCKRSESAWTASNILKSIFGKHPFLIVRNFSPEAKEKIKELIEEHHFDLIHAETFYIMPHIPETKIPVLLVEQTIEFRVYQHFVHQLRFPFIRPFFYFDIMKLKYWEKYYWKKAELVGAVSREDKEKMEELLPSIESTVIPNAAGEDLLNIYDPKRSAIKPIFLYQGNFSWLQNIEAAQILVKDIFPIIKKQIPDATCIIAGQSAQAKLGEIQEIDGVEIIDIPSSNVEAVIDVYRKSCIFLAPIEGPGGTRLKILGAMAAGLPVISSPTGISGLKVRDGEDVIIAHNPKQYAKAAVSLLKNKDQYQKIKTNARSVIENIYSWDSVASNLEKSYEKLIERKSL